MAIASKVFLITGATSGIGKALAVSLAQNGEVIVIVARDPNRGAAVLQEIIDKTHNSNKENCLLKIMK